MPHPSLRGNRGEPDQGLRRERLGRTAAHGLAIETGSFLGEKQPMFVNLSSESREQLLSLVQTMHLSEADVIAFAIKLLFDEKNPDQAGIISENQRKR